jgi:ribonuclease P protein component
MRFHAEQHLRRPIEIKTVREQGRRVDCRAFTLWWRQRPANPVTPAAMPRPRVCVIASTKAVGVAVQRNRAKRRLRELFRQHQAQVPADCDLLLIARAAATNCPMPELERKFAEACRQIVPAPAS